MLGNDQELRNKKPRSEWQAQLQGKKGNYHETTSNYTAKANLKPSHSRYDKGMELYKQGKVYFTKGMYKVNGYDVDLRTPVKCECPDFQIRKQACKHIYRAIQQKSWRGKDRAP